ncbi:hypothetical protein MHK_009196, partial [Candidatus Magnetomorum sp. HK-1]
NYANKETGGINLSDNESLAESPIAGSTLSPESFASTQRISTHMHRSRPFIYCRQ